MERFVSAESLLFCYTEDKLWDILLLDIEIGAMDGVSLAKKIRQENETVQIVFITGFADYISEGYEVSALHYLMKPVKQEELFAVFHEGAVIRRGTHAELVADETGKYHELWHGQAQYYTEK